MDACQGRLDHTRAPLLRALNDIDVCQESGSAPDRVTFLRRVRDKAIRVVDRHRSSAVIPSMPPGDRGDREPPFAADLPVHACYHAGGDLPQELRHHPDSGACSPTLWLGLPSNI